MEKINLIGASGHAKVIIEIAEQNNISIQQIYDADAGKSNILDYAIQAQEHINIQDTTPAIIAIGHNSVRQKVSQQCPLQYTTLIHPGAMVSGRAYIAAGTVVMAGVSINSDTTIGKHCIINTNASIDHDCSIADYVHISPNVGLAGGVTVGEGTHVGIGASVIQGIHIGKWATIGAGAVIIRDVPDYAVIVGNPGKIIKYNKPLKED